MAQSGIDCLITYGELAHRTATVAAAKGVRTIHAHSYEEIAGFLAKITVDAVLFKGSRAMALENAVQQLQALKDAEAIAAENSENS